MSVVLVGAVATACVDADPVHPFVESLGTVVALPAAGDALVDLLLRTDRSALPPFVLGIREAAGVRLFLRGAVTATTADGVTLDGRQATTWVETLVTSYGVLEVTVGDQVVLFMPTSAPGLPAVPVAGALVPAAAETPPGFVDGIPGSLAPVPAAASSSEDAAGFSADEGIPGPDAPIDREPDVDEGAAPPPEPEVAAEPQPAPEPEPAPQPAPAPEVAAEPQPAPAPEPQPEPEPEPQPAPSPEVAAEPQPAPAPDPPPAPAPEPEPQPAPAPEPQPTPEPAPQPTPAPDPVAPPSRSFFQNFGAPRPMTAGPDAVPPPPPSGPPVLFAPPPDAPVEPDGPRYDFSHLLGETQYRDVESAAVRPGEEEGDGEPAPAEPPAVEPPVEPPPVVEAPVVLQKPAAPPSLLIDAVPFARPAGVPAPVEVSGPRGVVPVPPPPGSTGIPLGPVTGPPVAAAPDAPGATVARTSLSGPVPVPVGPTVTAVHCPNGHANPVTVQVCRRCGADVLDRTTSVVPRPVLGRLHVADGQVIDVAGPVLVGRAPRADGHELVGGEPPALVALADPERLLSRTHLAVEVSGWEVLVQDCGSVNMSTVQLPGRPVEQLLPDRPVVLVSGSVVVLGDHARLTWEAGA